MTAEIGSKRLAWGVKFELDNRLDGHREYLGGGCQFGRHAAFGGYATMAFATRAAARKFIADNYAYFTRHDLIAEPHGWKMPKPVRVLIAVATIPERHAAMNSLAHDGAASLEVRHMRPSGGLGGAGWYVVRTCPCHKGEPITHPLDSREDAVVALAMLDEDARSHQ